MRVQEVEILCPKFGGYLPTGLYTMKKRARSLAIPFGIALLLAFSPICVGVQELLQTSGFSLGLVGVERGEEAAHLRFWISKEGEGGAIPSPVPVILVDDHGNEYEGTLEVDFGDVPPGVFSSLPQGFTYTDTVVVQVPSAAPIKVLRIAGNEFQLQDVEFGQPRLWDAANRFPPELEKRTVTAGEWLSFEVHKLLPARHHWELPIVIHNEEYNTLPGVVTMAVQHDDGTTKWSPLRTLDVAGLSKSTLEVNLPALRWFEPEVADPRTLLLFFQDGKTGDSVFLSYHLSKEVFPPLVGQGPREQEEVFLNTHARNGGRSTIGDPLGVPYWFAGRSNPRDENDVLVQEFSTEPGAVRSAIVWAKQTGWREAYYLSSVIWSEYVRLGGPYAKDKCQGEYLGYPSSNTADVTSRYGRTGIFSTFTNGLIASHTNGTFLVIGSIFKTWRSWSGLSGKSSVSLGFPIGNEHSVGPSGAQGFNTTGCAQSFEGGTLYLHTTGSLSGECLRLSSEFSAAYDTLGRCAGWLGFPTKRLSPHAFPFADRLEYVEAFEYVEFEGGILRAVGEGDNEWLAIPFVPSEGNYEIDATCSVGGWVSPWGYGAKVDYRITSAEVAGGQLRINVFMRVHGQHGPKEFFEYQPFDCFEVFLYDVDFSRTRPVSISGLLAASGSLDHLDKTRWYESSLWFPLPERGSYLQLRIEWHFKGHCGGRCTLLTRSPLFALERHKIVVGEELAQTTKPSVVTFVDASGRPISAWIEVDSLSIRVADPSHAGEPNLVGLEVNGVPFELNPLEQFDNDYTFVTDTITPVDIGLSAGDIASATYTDATDPSDSSSARIPIQSRVNLPPTADAGPDQLLFDTDGDGQKDVTLDGDGSRDSDGNSLTYLWTENGTQIATGVDDVVALSTGSHAITLTVTDDDGATDTDDVEIIVRIKEMLNCTIELREQDSSTLIDTIGVSESFDIYVGDFTGNPVQVRFSSDEEQNSVATGEWTRWFDWNASLGREYWDATAKIKAWAFTTSGEKELWAEVRDDADQTSQCHINIYANPREETSANFEVGEYVRIKRSPSATLLEEPRADSNVLYQVWHRNPAKILPNEDNGSYADGYAWWYVETNVEGRAFPISGWCREIDLEKNVLPTASFTHSPLTPRCGEDVVLDARTSEDSDGEIVVWRWNLNGAGGYTINPEIVYYWDKPGEYSVTLEVEDDTRGTDRITKTISVRKKSLWEKLEDLFGSVARFNSEWLKEIKRELRIKNWSQEIPIYDPDPLNPFYNYSDGDLATVLIQEMDKENAPGVTYGTYILDSIREKNLVRMASSTAWQNEEVIDAYFNDLADVNVWAGTAGMVSQDLLVGLIEHAGGSGLGISTILSLPALCEAGIGLKALDNTLYRRALWSYFDCRRFEDANAAFEDAGVPSRYYKTETKDYFESLWDTYEEFGGDPNLETSWRATLQNFLLAALEKYKFYTQIVLLKSAGELRVYDLQNRVTGLVNGEVKQEIPNSIYDEESKTAVISPATDSYRYAVVGVEQGDYGLDAISITSGEATICTVTEMTTAIGAVHRYTMNWDALRKGETGTTLQVDKNGDGVFEKTYQAGSKLDGSHLSTSLVGRTSLWLWIVVGLAIGSVGVVGRLIWTRILRKS